MNRLLVLSLAIGFVLPAAASDTPPTRVTEECWKASFTEQLSGPVSELSRGGRSGFTTSYDGDFKWKGKPATRASVSEYVFCFAKQLKDGGTLIANGKRIELDRIGSSRRPPLIQEGYFRNTVSIRDVHEFPRLYGIFSTPGKPDTSLEIQLEPLRGRAKVVSSTRDQAGRRIVSLLEGTATPVTP